MHPYSRKHDLHQLPFQHVLNKSSHPRKYLKYRCVCRTNRVHVYIVARLLEGCLLLRCSTGESNDSNKNVKIHTLIENLLFIYIFFNLYTSFLPYSTILNIFRGWLLLFRTPADWGISDARFINFNIKQTKLTEWKLV